MLPVTVCLPWAPALMTTWRRVVPPFMSDTVTIAVTWAAVVKVFVTTLLFAAVLPSSKSQ